jgi:hypothetical protein
MESRSTGPLDGLKFKVALDTLGLHADAFVRVIGNVRSFGRRADNGEINESVPPPRPCGLPGNLIAPFRAQLVATGWATFLPLSFPRATAAGFFLRWDLLGGSSEGLDSPVASSAMARASWFRSVGLNFVLDHLGMAILCDSTSQFARPLLTSALLGKRRSRPIML